MIIGIRFDAGLDRNGNPHRSVVAIDGKTGSVIGAVNEYEFSGPAAALASMAKGKPYALSLSVETTKSEVKRSVKFNSR